MTFHQRKAVQQFVGRLPLVGEMVFILDPTTVQTQIQPAWRLGLIKSYSCQNKEYFGPVTSPDLKSSEKKLSRLLNRDRKKIRTVKTNGILLGTLEVSVNFWFAEEEISSKVLTIESVKAQAGLGAGVLFMDLNQNKHFDEESITNYVQLGYFGDLKERLRIHQSMAKMAKDMGVDWMCFTQTWKRPAK